MLNPENWFWCDLCKCVSYAYGCVCGATSCNAAGCALCDSIAREVKDVEDSGRAPSEEEAKLNNLKRFGSVKTPETKLLEEIFA